MRRKSQSTNWIMSMAKPLLQTKSTSNNQDLTFGTNICFRLISNVPIAIKHTKVIDNVFMYIKEITI